MSKLIKPEMMQQILTHSQGYYRAIRLLNLNWDLGDQILFRDQVLPGDVNFARQLQDHQLINGKVNLNNYQEVSQMISGHPAWFTERAQQALLDPFND